MANNEQVSKERCPHDKWVHVSKWISTLLLVCIPPGVGWITWITQLCLRNQYELEVRTVDRFTSGMFIDVQQQLSAKNPDMEWLNAAEIREIQRRTFPFEER